MTERDSPALPRHLLAWIREEGLLDRALPSNPSRGLAEADWGPELEALLQAGSVQEADLEAGLWSLLEASTRQPAAPDGPAAAQGSLDIRDQLRNWDRYRDLKLLGVGGGGAVYEAYDPRLDRKVALKFLWSQAPETLSRLIREAKAQAQIEHPHVVKVYEVDSARGLWFISMQLVRGKNLAQLAPELPLQQRVLLLMQAAEAAHAAHRLGMIHLDLKLGNILVERQPDGVLWAYLADFGLAQGAPEGSGAGVPLGTLPFSSPEQVRGEAAAIDRRSDVYSLGICLYRLASGRLPFDNLDARVFQGPKPVPPISLAALQPGLSADLVAIVDKAMAWAPGDRYDTARAFAADLDRFLNGDPVAARGSHWRYRLGTQLRKHRLRVALGGLAAAVLLAMAGFTLWNQQRNARQVALAQGFGRRVEQIDSQLWREYSLPLHDVRPVRESARRQLREMAAEIERFAPQASGPGHAALGRGLASLGDFAGARGHLQRAWAAGHRTPEVAYLEGLVLGHLFKQERDAAAQLADPGERQRRIAEAARTLRDPALDNLRTAGGAVHDPPEYVQGLIAFFEDRHGPALALAARARQAAPWFHPAWQLAGDIHFALAVEGSQHGDYATFSEGMQKADEAYQQGIQIARSNPEALARRGVVAARKVEIEVHQRGLLDEAAYGRAKAACREALVANPDDPWLKERLAWLGLAGAKHRIDRNRDPGPFLADAQEALADTIRTQPERAEGWILQSRIAHARALWAESRDRDPRPELREAAHFAEQAVAQAPASSQAHYGLGSALMDAGAYALGHGGDPFADSLRARVHIRRAADLAPADLGVQSGLAAINNLLARARLERGQPVEEALAEARQAIDRVLAIHPTSYWAHRNAIGTEYLNAWAAFLARQDPRPAIARAEAHERAALKANADGEGILWESIFLGKLLVAYTHPAGSPARQAALGEAAQALRSLRRLGTKPSLLRTFQAKMDKLSYFAS